MSQLSQGALDQEAGDRLTKAETSRQKTLRGELWQHHMLPVARIAREVFGGSGVDKALRMPKNAVKHEAVINVARAMVEAAALQSAVFIQHGLPNEFVARMNQAVNDFDAALKTRDVTRRRRLTATAAVAEQLKRGRRAVRLLNAILQPRLAQDPELLAAWDNVRRLKTDAERSDGTGGGGDAGAGWQGGIIRQQKTVVGLTGCLVGTVNPPIRQPVNPITRNSAQSSSASVSPTLSGGSSTPS